MSIRRMPSRKTTAVAMFTIVGFGLAGCGSSGGTAASSPSMSPKSSMSPMSSMSPKSSMSSPAQSSSAAEPVVITIKDFAYQAPKTVSPGAKITVKNDDSTAHTVTADSGNAFDVTIKPGESAMLTAPDKPGSYPYHCTFHSNMKGTLVVK